MSSVDSKYIPVYIGSMKTKKRKFKWSERQKRALRGSIRKWEKIVDGTGEDLGIDNCPCCARYWDAACGSCPIAIYTGRGLCLGTPYYYYIRGTNNTIKNAKKELNFIKDVYKAGL